MTETPRRINLAAFTPAERAIYDAVQAVEAMAADVRLTDAVILLQAARDSVADYIDNIWPSRRYVSALPASASPHPHGEELKAEIARWAIYCFNHHGNDAALYNALADLAGPEAMKAPSARPASLDETQQP